MPGDGKRNAAARRRRVRRLKHLIILTLLALILLPTICCVALMVQIRSLNLRVDEITARLEALECADKPQAATDSQQGSGEHYADDGEGVASGTLPQQFQKLNDGRVDPLDTVHKVYLTFDDGPSIYTDKILDILAEYDVKATFFVVGKEDEHSKEAIQKIVQEGHTLGMHSYSHKYSELYASRESFEEDFQKERAFLEGLTGEPCRFYRFPGGSSNTVSHVNMREFAEYLESEDTVFFDWNISSGDGGSRLLDVDTLVKNSTADVSKWYTAVILMHDSGDKPTTVEALPQIIEKIQAMDNTVILPISKDTDTTPVQHIFREKQ